MSVKNPVAGGKELVFVPGEIEYAICRSRGKGCNEKALKFACMSFEKRKMLRHIMAEFKARKI